MESNLKRGYNSEPFILGLFSTTFVASCFFRAGCFFSKNVVYASSQHSKACQGKFSKSVIHSVHSNENVEEGLATQRVGLQDPAVSHSGSHPFVILHLTSPWQDKRTMKNLIDSSNLICLEGIAGLEKHKHTHTHLLTLVLGSISPTKWGKGQRRRHFVHH